MAKEYNVRLAEFLRTLKADGSEAAGPHTITDNPRQSRSKMPRRSVFVNGEFAFGLSEECFVKTCLYRGTALTIELLEQVQQIEQEYQAKQQALRMLNRRMRSRREIESTLREKGFVPEAIADALRFLSEYNMLDDAQFARAFIHDRLLRKPVGKRKLKMELLQRGIGKDDAEEILAGAISNDRELNNAIVAARSRVVRMRGDDVKKNERSLVAFLQGRGFSWDVIRNAVTAAMQQAGSVELAEVPQSE